LNHATSLFSEEKIIIKADDILRYILRIDTEAV
jgi:hypothetical protein